MDKDNRKKFMTSFDKVKKKYDAESKERLKERTINEIKKDNEAGCGCKG
jgi:predicted nucleic acid-binding OB-fold protein